MSKEKQIASQVPLEVIYGNKQPAIVTDVTFTDGSQHKGLFRACRDTKEVDTRVSAGEELNRDHAFYLLSTLLGWDIVVPNWLSSLEGRNGTIEGITRLYYPNVKTYAVYAMETGEPFQTKADLTFLRRAAALDYFGAVIDRYSNDILQLVTSWRLIDSGLSFVSGLDFVTHSQILRELAKDMPLTEEELTAISQIALADFGLIADVLQDRNLVTDTYNRGQRLLKNRATL
jgi:hypothetical protein